MEERASRRSKTEGHESAHSWRSGPDEAILAPTQGQAGLEPSYSKRGDLGMQFLNRQETDRLRRARSPGCVGMDAAAVRAARPQNTTQRCDRA